MELHGADPVRPVEDGLRWFHGSEAVKCPDCQDADPSFGPRNISLWHKADFRFARSNRLVVLQGLSVGQSNSLKVDETFKHSFKLTAGDRQKVGL